MDRRDQRSYSARNIRWVNMDSGVLFLYFGARSRGLQGSAAEVERNQIGRIAFGPCLNPVVVEGSGVFEILDVVNIEQRERDFLLTLNAYESRTTGEEIHLYRKMQNL